LLKLFKSAESEITLAINKRI